MLRSIRRLRGRFTDSYAWRIGSRLGLIYCVGYTLEVYVGSLWRLSDHSMEPTFKDGQLVLCSSWPWFCDVQKGDVIIAKHPIHPEVKICKRIVGQFPRTPAT